MASYEFFPNRNELRWGNQIYRGVVGGLSLKHDLRLDHGPILKVEPRHEKMGWEYVQVFFRNLTYTGAELKCESDARLAFDIIIAYMRKHNGIVLPLNFLIQFGNNRFSILDFKAEMARRKNISGLFPGARKMKLPFKEAVEQFLLSKYSKRIGKGLTRAEIRRDDPKLYMAIKDYQKQFGNLPFDIPSVRQIAEERFQRVVQLGLKNAPRRDRDAANRMTRRISRQLENG